MNVAALAAAIVLTTLSSSATAQAPRSIWIWGGPDVAVIDEVAADGFDVAFLHAPPGFDPDAYATFIQSAQASGIEVYAVGGDPAWATDRRAWSDWVGEVVASGLFAGMVADVEPYLLPDWGDSKAQSRLINSYLRRLDSAHEAAGSMDMIAAVPFWWDLPEYERRGESLVERVLDRSDGIVVMAYRDHALGADGIVEHASTELNAAFERQKPAWIGIETAASAIDKVTFAEEGRTYLEAEIAVALEALPGAAGVAVHHLDSWRLLPE